MPNKKLQKFSFTADCSRNIINFIIQADVHLVSYKMKTPWNEDESCKFKFRAHLSRQEVISIIKDISESDRMIETLVNSDVYP